MTGHHCGLVTRMVVTAKHPVLLIWCVPHQIYLVVMLAGDCVAYGTWIKLAWFLSFSC